MPFAVDVSSSSHAGADTSRVMMPMADAAASRARAVWRHAALVSSRHTRVGDDRTAG